MKVLGIVGSPRRGGNTETLVGEALRVCREEGLETEMITLADKTIQPCAECMYCKSEKTCSNQEDDFLPVFEKMKEAQGIILSSPVFFGSATPQIKALIDRAGYLGIAEGRPFERKVGGALVVARRAGQNFTFSQLLYFFLYHGMIVPGSTYWNIAFGKEPGEVNNDQEGLQTARNFAKNMCWLIKKINY